jgi:tetratricopeptide (TPR) repeat protein
LAKLIRLYGETPPGRISWNCVRLLAVKQSRIGIAIGVVALALTSVAAPAVAADARELKAREEFAAGRYHEALDLFAKLYAETLHPVYLRNVGRCYQNLGDPDRAIISFRDYLRKHKTIEPEERREVEGFISEMEQLKKQREAAASVATPSTPPPKPASTIPVLPRAAQPATDAAPEAFVTAPAGQSSKSSSPVYTRWWFWTIVGAGAVGAGLGVAAWTGALTRTMDAPCRTGYHCQLP